MSVILLGAPGSGKGTQANHIVNTCNLQKIATGDLLRAEIAKKSELGTKIQDSVESGALVSDEIMTTLVDHQFDSGSYDGGAIFDGFPRTITQAEVLDKILTRRGQKIDVVIELEVKKTSLVDRLSNRYYCKQCNVGYNKLFKNPKQDGICDICQGSEFAIRKDDEAQIIKKRFHEYKKQTGLLLPYYEVKGLVNKVNGEDDIKVVSKNIDLIMKQMIAY